MLCHSIAARRGVPVDTACLERSHNLLALFFTHAEARAGCLTAGDHAAIAARVNAFVDDVVASLRSVPDRSSCVGTKLLAAGLSIPAQTLQYGAHYTRPDTTRLLRFLSMARKRYRGLFAIAERQNDCRTAGDQAEIAARADALLGDLLFRLGTDARLRHLAARRGIALGAAAGSNDSSVVMNEPEYTQTLAREFDYLTPENDLKWGLVHPQANTWSFDRADTLIDFAESHGMRVKGHALLWHQQLPSYVSSGMTAAQLGAAVDEHIATLVGRYRGRIAAWDVVNEAVRDNGTGLRPTVFLNTLGPGYIAEAFRRAHEADPEAQLIYNDYGAETINPKSNFIYAMVQDLLQQGVPIHGVGLQAHLSAGFVNPTTTASIQANIQRFADLGLRVNLSEMDLRISPLPGDLASRLAVQRQAYHDVVAACLAVSGCDAVTFWGFTDKYSWIDSFFGPDDPLLFDELYAPKPAYSGVAEALVQ
jgi:GH35 family endo-1,4-beta-xylanase